IRNYGFINPSIESSFTLNIKQSPIDDDNEIIKEIDVNIGIRLFMKISAIKYDYWKYQRFMIDLFAFAILNFVLIIQTG
ncbi:hypothetical protein DERF_010797, partial [Dermatophagoides farinae]